MYALWIFCLYTHVHILTCTHIYTHKDIHISMYVYELNYNVLNICFLPKMHEANSPAFNICIYDMYIFGQRQQTCFSASCHLLWKAWNGSWIMNSSRGWEFNEVFYFNHNIWELLIGQSYSLSGMSYSLGKIKGMMLFFFFMKPLLPQSVWQPKTSERWTSAVALSCALILNVTLLFELLAL